MLMAMGNGAGRIASGLQMLCPQHIMMSNSAFALASAGAVAIFHCCSTETEFMVISLVYGFTSGPLYGLQALRLENLASAAVQCKD